MKIKRRKTKVIRVGQLQIGGSSPISVQSMTKSRLEDATAIRNEIKELIVWGCELVRIAVPEKKSVIYLKELVDEGIFSIPVIGDIQFDYRLALECMDAGVDGIRINPGNIGGPERTAEVIKRAKETNTAVRIGINSGSIDKKILKKNKGKIVDSMVESALENVRLLESLEFNNFKISAKASSVLDTVNAYEAISDKVDWPLHLGVTEAGPLMRGSIKSAVGMGVLLSKGIGDTIRVSLTDKSVEEVKAAYTILNSLKLRRRGIDIISCPTCGRTMVNLNEMVRKVERLTAGVRKNLKLALMGCIVNGPGEAKEADLGIAFGSRKAAIFLKGKVLKRVDMKSALKVFEKELEKLI
jgi:(E)-4-hydroxy-3-methylbut-2-enyl-diphosphate synthase